jgi:hypothetical protein
VKSLRSRLSVIGTFSIGFDTDEVVKLPKRACQVIAGLAITPEHAILRTDITELVWPLSEAKSRDVLLHQTRRTIADAYNRHGFDAPVAFVDRVIKLDTTHIDIDFVQASLQAGYALANLTPSETMSAAMAFDEIVGGKILLVDFPDTFNDQRTQFNQLRHSVLLGGYSAAIHLGENAISLHFGNRLRETGYTQVLPSSNRTPENELRESGVSIQGQVTGGNALQPDNPSTLHRSSSVIKLRYALWIGISVVTFTLISLLVVANVRSSKVRPGQLKGLDDRTFFTYKPINSAFDSSRAVGIATFGNNDVVVLIASANKDNSPEFLVKRITRGGKVVWSRSLAIDDYGPSTLTNLTVAQNGDLFVTGTVDIRGTKFVALSPGVHPVIHRVSSDGATYTTTVLPTRCPDGQINQHLEPDVKAGAWFAIRVLHDVQGLSTALYHMNISGRVDSMAIMPVMLTALVPTKNETVILVGKQNTTPSNRLPTRLFVSAVGLSGQSIWYTRLNGGVDTGADVFLNRRDARLSLILSLGGSKPRYVMETLDTSSGDVVSRTSIDNTGESNKIRLSGMSTERGSIIAGSPSKTESADHAYFSFSQTDSKNPGLSLAVKIPFTSQIMDVTYLSCKGNNQFRALINVQNFKNTGKPGVAYIRKDKGKDIEVIPFTGPTSIERENIDAGVAAVNSGSSFKLMQIDDLL